MRILILLLLVSCGEIKQEASGREVSGIVEEKDCMVMGALVEAGRAVKEDVEFYEKNCLDDILRGLDDVGDPYSHGPESKPNR